jgi:hypothetical protein
VVLVFSFPHYWQVFGVLGAGTNTDPMETKSVKERKKRADRSHMARQDRRVHREGPVKEKRKEQERKKEAKRSLDASYNAYKMFEGKQYTGMKIGRGHKWYYDKGEWKEKKVTPDKWEFKFEVTKRRAGKAPEGSGVPVGTEYHWYILAHQHVKKLNANDYSTSMSGLKYKIAHKRADKDKWSASEKAQKKRLIKVLKEMIVSLEAEEVEHIET